VKRKSILFGAIVAILVVVFAWGAAKLFGKSPAAQPSLAPLMPQGAALVLEAKDFANMLGEWNSSPVKQQWLKSGDFEVFSRSRVLQRLEEARRQFAAAGGVPPDMHFLSQAAGKESILGIYDIGKLEFLYITRLSSDSAMQSGLWQARSKFESRNAAGTPFFVHTDTESGRTLAFALDGDYLLLATREDLLVSALELVGYGKGSNVTGEEWYVQAVSSAGEPGDLRMVLNMEKIVAAPQFRSYWIQDNLKEMKQYSSAISDLYRSGSVYREERVLLRKPAGADATKPQPSGAPSEPTPEGMQSAADLLRLVPDDAGVYRATANPGTDEPFTLLQTRILSPRTSSAPLGNLAPAVNLSGGEVGNSADLEIHIDQSPIVSVAKEDGASSLRKEFESAEVQGMLVLASSHADTETPFVEIRTTVAFSAANDWDASAVLPALAGAIAQPNTTQHLGAVWKKAGKAPNDYMELDGLLPIRVAIRGKILIASNGEEMIAEILPRLKNRTSAPPASFAAGFRHASEQQNFIYLTADLDHPSPSDSENDDTNASTSYPGGATHSNYNLAGASQPIPPAAPGESNQEPQFFSGNLASLSRVFTRLDSESVIIRDASGKTFQTVIYRWK
jgi:hypothetical protein